MKMPRSVGLLGILGTSIRGASSSFSRSTSTTSYFSTTFVLPLQRETGFALTTNRKTRHLMQSLSQGYPRALSVSSCERTVNEIKMHEHARSIAEAGINAVDPKVAIETRLSIFEQDDMFKLGVQKDDGKDLEYDLRDYEKVYVIAFGKASMPMAQKVCDIFGEAEESMLAKGVFMPSMEGVVIVKDDHATQEEIRIINDRYNVVVREASHPVPDQRGITAAETLLHQVQDADEKSLIICCISGGGSALFCSPRDELTLDDMSQANQAFLASGMDIEKINVIRKRLERGKGGGLAAAAYPATMVTLVLSDIIGDPLDLIASGPTVPDDNSTWKDALKLVDSFGLGRGQRHELPTAVLDVLERGERGELDDTPKSCHPVFFVEKNTDQKLSETVLVGNNAIAVMAAANKASQLGYDTKIISTNVSGEAATVSALYVAMAEQLVQRRFGEDSNSFFFAQLPCALISGGETTVTLDQSISCDGFKGGRNQELGLIAAMKLKESNTRDVVLISVGTDGTDGPTDAAGAVVDGGSVDRIDALSSYTAETALKNHDSYHYLSQESDALVKTGPTGTNVADIACLLIV